MSIKPHHLEVAPLIDFAQCRAGLSYTNPEVGRLMVDSISIPMFAIRHKQIGGTEYATYNLIKGIHATGVPVRLILDRDEHLAPEFRQWLAENPGVERDYQLKFPGPKNIRFLQETLFGLSRRSDEWALYPNYFFPPVRRSSRRPNAVILFDVQYKSLPGLHSSRRIQWLDFYLPQLFQRADSVLLISQWEKDLIDKYFGRKAAEKCDIINIAMDWDRFDAKLGDSEEWAAELLAHPYLLSVCHPFPHKNLQTLLAAFQQLAPRHPDVFLYLVGQNSPANQVFINAKLSGEIRQRVKILGYLPDAKLGVLYRHARLVAIPSLYEGFGMPAVEALAAGTPTIVSSNSSMPEVTLGLATYVDRPKDTEAWTAGIEALLSSGDRPDHNAVSRVRAAYSTPTVAKKLLDTLAKRAKS